MADEDISPYISWPGKTRCPWILFHANALTLLDTLYGETCSSQAKINKFIAAAKRHFARSPTRGKKSKKQAYKVIHIPGESCSKQKATATNRQSCQPAPTSCRDRSLTPHPFGRGKADTREERQPTSNSHRARSPTPPRRCRNANTRTSSQSNHSFYIDTIQLHHNSTHSTVSQPANTNNSSFQDQFRCIPGPSTRKRVNSSRIPIPSKLSCQNLASSHKSKPQGCNKGVSRIPVPHGRKKHIAKSIIEDHAHEAASITSDTDSVDNVCAQPESPRDITASDQSHNRQGDARVYTIDQILSATVQPEHQNTSQPTETSPSRSTTSTFTSPEILPSRSLTLSDTSRSDTSSETSPSRSSTSPETSPSQPITSSPNTHNHKKQYSTRPLSAMYNKGPPPLLPQAITSRPQHIANSKRRPALLPTPVRSRSSAIPSSRQQLHVPSPMLNHLTSPAHYGAITKVPHHTPRHTPLYLPVIILTLTDKFTKLFCPQGHQDTAHQKQYIHKGIQTDTITSL